MYEINLRKYREKFVNAFYNYFLTGKTMDQMKQDVLDETQIKANDEIEKALMNIVEKAPELKLEIEKYLKEDWKWDRLPFFIQSILVEGVWEIQNTNIDKAITINELVKYTKEVEPDFDYKFVNGILDKFSKPETK